MPDDLKAVVQRMIDSGESEENIATVIQHAKAQIPVAPAPTPKDRTWGDTAIEVGKGMVKGAGSTIASLGEMAGNAGMLPGVRPNAFGPSEMRNPALTKAEAATTATNTPQMVGKGLETAAELALPVLKGASAIPRAGRAASKLQGVMSVAKDVPLDVSQTGDAALRIQQLAERGGAMPMAVRKFLGRVTDPQKAPMAYEEGQDFASNISRLSADEFQRLTPVVRREVGQMREALRKSLADAADTVGKGKDYTSGVAEYAKAMKLRDAGSAIAKGAKQALPLASGSGAGYLIMKKLLGGLE